MLMKKFCPNCGSDEVDLVAGGITGGYMCRDCGYTGIFPEKPLMLEEDVVDNVSKKKIKSKVKRKK